MAHQQNKFRLTALALAFGMLGALPAAAHNVACLPRAVLVERLKQNHNENVLLQGPLDHQENVIMEFAVAPQGETWTIITSDTNGMSCLWFVGADLVRPIPDRAPPPAEEMAQ